MCNIYVFAFRHLYLQCARSRTRDLTFNITDKFLVLYIKFPNNGFYMNYVLICKNDLSENFVSNLTLFADDTSLFNNDLGIENFAVSTK